MLDKAACRDATDRLRRWPGTRANIGLDEEVLKKIEVVVVLPQLVLLQTQMLTTHLGESRVPVPAMVQAQPIYVPQLQQQGPGKLQSKRQRTENIFVPQCKCMARNMFPVTLRQSVAMMSGVLDTQSRPCRGRC